MIRLTSRSDGRGQPLSLLLESWAVRNPKIRRVWLLANAGRESADPEDIAIALELQPVGDSEETLAIWMAHCEQWSKELAAHVGHPIPINWRDPDRGKMATPRGTEGAGTLVYERVR